MRNICTSLLTALALSVLAAPACAEAAKVRLAKQFGISYLPLTLMEENHLFEKNAKALGLDVTTEWLQFSAGPVMNDALLSGTLDFASGGVGPMLTLWGKTRGRLNVRAVAALNSMPIALVSSNPGVKKLADFTAKDKIALPAVKTSMQALMLHMAAARELGPGKEDALDVLTVSLGHPDAFNALMSFKTEINAHFGAAPFTSQELEDPRVHKIVDSFEVLGGPHTFNVVWATQKFHDENPKLTQAFVNALTESMALIQSDPAGAAAIWVKAERSKLSAAEAQRLITLPENEWTIVPKKVMVFAQFMAKAGQIGAAPADWKEIFFDNIHALAGN